MRPAQAGMTGRRPPQDCSIDIQGEDEVEAYMKGRAAEHRVVLGDELRVTIYFAIACNLQQVFWQSAFLEDRGWCMAATVHFDTLLGTEGEVSYHFPPSVIFNV